jgi:AraC-like DNA-binding protein
MESNDQTIRQTLGKFRTQLIETTYPPPQPTIDIDLSYARQFTEEQVPQNILCALGCIHDYVFERQLTIAYLKKRCNVSSNSLSGAFKYYVGKTPKQYINIRRVEAAARLLKDVQLQQASITNIAMSVGYNRPSTFGKAFKRITGRPPGRWRKDRFK